jgi:hypothetical protein
MNWAGKRESTLWQKITVRFLSSNERRRMNATMNDIVQMNYADGDLVLEEIQRQEEEKKPKLKGKVFLMELDHFPHLGYFSDLETDKVTIGYIARWSAK